MTKTYFSRRLRALHMLITAMGLCVAVLVAGCPDNGGGTPTPDGSLAGRIVNVTSNIRLTGAQVFTVVYDATGATNVGAFFVKVESTLPNAPEIPPAVTFDGDLPTGTGMTVSLDTTTLTVGIYRVGLNLTAGDTTLRVLSTGSIEVTELQPPVFELPNQNLAVLPGTAVDVRADLGDPENAVQWRLFYVDAASPTQGIPADQLGTQITTGAANQAIVTWSTGGVPFGNYRIGISVTDSGQSIAQTVASGQEDKIITVFNEFLVQIVSEEPTAHPPSVAVTQPSGNHNLLEDEVVQILFSVTVFEGPPADQSVTVFYDLDGEADTGDEVVISEGLPVTATSAVLSGALLTKGQAVHVGVTADDGKNDPVTGYATGLVTRVSVEDATLVVTQPSAPLTRRPGDIVDVAWQTNLPTSAKAKTNVYLRRLNAAGQPTSVETDISTTGLPLTQTTYQFVANNPGRFLVNVEIAFTDGNEPLSTNGPQPVVVSTQPSILWLGDTAQAPANSSTLRLTGAVFEGVQFEDNAGSSMDGGVDFNDDGFEDFVLVSRYGKPEFINPSGVGIGEAYLIRGQPTRYLGSFNLNSVSSSTVPGVVFSGVDATPSDETDGIARVFITHDSDGDNIGEIAFGFPYVSSAFVSSLGGQVPGNLSCSLNSYREQVGDDYVAVPQFHRGGVVVTSSLNKVISTGYGNVGGVRVPLGWTGQLFESSTFEFVIDEVYPEPDLGTICNAASGWMEDRLAWSDSESCPDLGCTPEAVGCLPGSDGEADTLVKPDFGFDPRLADPWYCSFFGRFLERCGITGEGLWTQCPACDEICGPGEVPNCQCTLGYDDPDRCPGTRELCDDSALETCDPDYECTPESDTSTDPKCECDEQKDLAEFTFTYLHRPLIEGIAGATSGFYRERVSPRSGTEGDDTTNYNNIVENRGNRFGMVGARFIGREVNDGAGLTITQSDDDLIIGSPHNEDGPLTDDGTVVGAGNAYLIRFDPVAGNSRPGLGRYWNTPDDPERALRFFPDDYDATGVNVTPVMPHQYLVGGSSHFGTAPGTSSTQGHWDTNDDWSSADGVRIIGNENEFIKNILAIPDFNRDNRSDIVVGAPLADIDAGAGNGPDGAVYILFRRQRSLEGNFELADLRRNISDPERLSGVLVREALGSGQRFGESVAGDFDFNTDGVADVVVGNPDGNGTGASNANATGEIVIIFGSNTTVSQQNGIPVETDAGGQGLLERRQGARIRGFEPGGEFGFNVANIGDIDGDGRNDLAIAAPNASPYFDSNPTDAIDSLDPAVNSFSLRGLDRNLDGVRDDVSGPKGIPDSSIVSGTNTDVNDELRHSGVVYVILSSTLPSDFGTTPTTGLMDINISQLGSKKLKGFAIVGHRGERYANRTAGTLVFSGDFLGGGLAGETVRQIPFSNPAINVDYGGNTNKQSTSRERDRPVGFGRAGDLDHDGFDDFIIGAQLADPRIDTISGEGVKNGGEAYLIYGFKPQ